MPVRRDDRSSGQKTLRSVGLAVILLTTLLSAALALTYLSGGQGSGWKPLVSSGGLAAATIALAAMLVDAFDFWMRDRRLTPFSLRMTRSLVFVAMLVAIFLSVLASIPMFFLLMTPALMIYLFGVARRRPQAGRRSARGSGGRSGESAARSSAPSRQRRGGRKRK